MISSQLKIKLVRVLTRMSNYEYYDIIFNSSNNFNCSPIKNLAEKLITHEKTYDYFDFYYEYYLPEIIKLHREYFSRDGRGFGEKPFHALWFLLFKEFQPINILEIGVFRGQTLSLFSILGKFYELQVDVHGISPLDSSGDTYSDYSRLDYVEDINSNFKRFNLPIATLHKGYSTDIDMIEVIKSKTWDLIYIDGSHDYDIIKMDIQNCLLSLKKGGILILDDASLYLDYKPQKGTFKGHPGPSKASDELTIDNRVINIINVGHNRVFLKCL